MAETATIIDEQIELLKGRGMEMTDEQKTRENLMDIGYFRLSFYWFPFEQTYPRKTKRNHAFKEGTKFDYAIKLYYFDFDLRNLLLRYISRIEVNFRTILIYTASNKYKDDPFWYVNPRYVKAAFIDDSLFKNAINDASKETVIKQDLQEHKRTYAPAWKLIENLTFGVVISLYDNLMDGGLKHDISKAYGMESSNQFSNYINTIRRLRNYCAHGKVLFDMNLPEAISNGPVGNLSARKTMLSGAYLVFKYILGKVSSNRVKDMMSELKLAFEKTEFQAVKNAIYDNSGFREEDI